MKRRHQVNHDLLLIGLPRKRKGLVVWVSSVVAAVGLTCAVAIPIVAQPSDDRQGNIPIAIDALSDPALFNNGPVYVSQDAPLNAFGGSGQELAIDGRPLGMVAGAAEESEDDPETALLAGAVGAIGQLPGDLQLMHPVTTRRISSPYGWRSNPTGAGNQIHIGQDYPIACGSPVYASEDGTVTVSGWHGHSGMRVSIDHGFNVQTGYSHNSKLIAKIGQVVKQGELIALAGTTGNSTGCHVHFEVIIDGRWHDPRNYLPTIPGQASAMIDSTRLTVNSNSAPRGNGSQSPSSQAPNNNPDVIVPKDDTPVVPKPKPKPTPTESHSPSPTQGTHSPSPSDSNSPSPSDETEAPTEGTKSPTPTDTESGTPNPVPDTSTPPTNTTPPTGTTPPTDSKTPDSKTPQDPSVGPSGSNDGANSDSPKPSESGSGSKTPTGQSEVPASGSTSVTPSAP